MSASNVFLRAAVALGLGLVVIVGCRTATDGHADPPQHPAADASGAMPAPERDTRITGGTPTYRLAVIRSHALVVVLESTSSVDAVEGTIEVAVGRAVEGGYVSGPVLGAIDPAPVAGGRLRPVRSTEPPRPLGACVSVTPWSGAESFVGLAYEDAIHPEARLSEFVLRYPDAARAAEGALRIRYQFEDCPARGPGGEVHVRTREQRFADGTGEVFIGERFGAAA